MGNSKQCGTKPPAFHIVNPSHPIASAKHSLGSIEKLELDWHHHNFCRLIPFGFCFIADISFAHLTHFKKQFPESHQSSLTWNIKSFLLFTGPAWLAMYFQHLLLLLLWLCRCFPYVKKHLLDRAFILIVPALWQGGLKWKIDWLLEC